jgi:hypothetical protein
LAEAIVKLTLSTAGSGGWDWSRKVGRGKSQPMPGLISHASRFRFFFSPDDIMFLNGPWTKKKKKITQSFKEYLELLLYAIWLHVSMEKQVPYTDRLARFESLKWPAKSANRTVYDSIE